MIIISGNAVVRKPCHNELVEQPVAEWGICNIHLLSGSGRHRAYMEHSTFQTLLYSHIRIYCNHFLLGCFSFSLYDSWCFNQTFRYLWLTHQHTDTSRSLNLCMYYYFQRDMFVLKEMRPVMELDSLNASHPLSLKESEVETSSDILGLFDSITYSKAGLMSLYCLWICAHVNVYQKIIDMWFGEQNVLCLINRGQLC